MLRLGSLRFASRVPSAISRSAAPLFTGVTSLKAALRANTPQATTVYCDPNDSVRREYAMPRNQDHPTSQPDTAWQLRIKASAAYQKSLSDKGVKSPLEPLSREDWTFEQERYNALAAAADRLSAPGEK